ncbi:MAG: hypothetical protein RBS35_01385 [Azonexus sp.]|jgi:hypothetical protein|nr:hypothetical protein [Azonexus sp.]
MSNHAIEDQGLPSMPVRRVRSTTGQGGAVLAVVLVVLVVMMLGGVSLLSSVDTSALLSGNIGFKRQALNATGRGLNQAFAKMKLSDFRANQDSIAGCPPPVGTGTACSKASIWASLNFYPRLLESDENGVPVILKDKAKFDSTFTAGTLKTQGTDETRFLIERMCNSYGPSTLANCMLSGYSPRGGTGWAGKPGSTASPLYRITVRTDGVRNSLTYSQWIVAFTEE